MILNRVLVKDVDGIQVLASQDIVWMIIFLEVVGPNLNWSLFHLITHDLPAYTTTNIQLKPCNSQLLLSRPYSHGWPGARGGCS